MVRRWHLSKKEIKAIKKSLIEKYPNIPLGFECVEKVIEKGMPEILIIDGIPAFFIKDDKYYPLLTLLLKKGIEWVPYIIVDIGAVKPILRGADLMAPGIVNIVGDFAKGDPVVVVEEKMNKPFMVGMALVNSKDLVEGRIKRGKVVENLHRLGDKLWSYVRGL